MRRDETMSRHESHVGHGEPAPVDAVAGQASSASVMLDIGGGRGALVIYPDERYRHQEIEISRTDGSSRRVHTGVHDRATTAGMVLTAVFGSLAEGEYMVWVDETTEGPTVAVADGSVTELRLDQP
jgi:hypothetical protein